MTVAPPASLMASRYFSRFSQNPEDIRPVLEFLFTLFSQGHTAFPINTLPQAWRDLQEKAEGYSSPEPAWEKIHGEKRLFGPPGEMTPFVMDSGLITLRQLFEKEQLLAGNLLQLRDRRSTGRQTDSGVPRFSVLEGRQRLAVERALGRGVFILSGGPGTGKTFTLTHILLQYLVQDPQIPVSLLAPTGRAADRIRFSIGAELAQPEYAGWNPEVLGRFDEIQPKTIHRFLGEVRQAGVPRSGVVVVDEASMADLHILTELTSALDLQNTCLILAGDKDQLPSVENGAILADLTRDAENPPLPTAVLTKCFRAGDALVEVSRGLVGFETARLSFDGFRKSLVPGKLDWTVLPPDQPAGRSFLREVLNREVQELCRLLPAGADCRLSSLPDNWLEEGENPRISGHFRSLESRIFLCAGRYGMLGTRELNARMARISGAGDSGPGTPVMVTHNNRDLGIFNGDRGLVYSAPDRSLWVLLPRSGGFQVLPHRIVKPLSEPAWAITIHKSQGSEYGEVRVFLDLGTENLLTREILYTGITRARKSARITASEEALQRALSRDAQRHTGLAEALLRAQADPGGPP